MYDKELALEILRQVYGATQTVLKRFEPIKSVDDFLGGFIIGKEFDMNKITENQTTIIRTDRGLSVAGTRITLYQIMDCLKAGMSPALICERFRLTIRQITNVIEYIKNHRDEVEAEYQQVLAQAESNRQYWENRNQKRMAEITTMPPKPGQEEIWRKLQQWKTRLNQSQ